MALTIYVYTYPYLQKNLRGYRCLVLRWIIKILCLRVLSSVCVGGGGGGEASTPNSLASTPKNSNCNTNYYGVGPLECQNLSFMIQNGLKYNLVYNLKSQIFPRGHAPRPL